MAKWIGKLPEIIPVQKKELTTQEFYEQLQEAIADLPEVFRTTIVLREIEGMPHEEIAEITGVSRNCEECQSASKAAIAAASYLMVAKLGSFRYEERS